MISPMTSSTTLRVLEYGALKTAMPRVGRGGQVDLVGADAEAADGQQVGGRVEHPRGDRGVGADAEQRTPGSASTSSSSRSEPVRSSTSKPRASSVLDGDGVDVLQQQYLHRSRVGGGRPGRRNGVRGGRRLRRAVTEAPIERRSGEGQGRRGPRAGRLASPCDGTPPGAPVRRRRCGRGPSCCSGWPTSPTSRPIGVAILALPIYVTGPVGSDEAGAGLAFGAFGITALVCRPFAGRLSDRWGRRPLLVFGALVCARGHGC